MFGLQNQPIDFQLTKHINNLKIYWAFENILNRMPEDQFLSYNNNDIVTCLTQLVNANDADIVTKYSYFRNQMAMPFRCQQLIQHYGKDAVIQYLKEVYGSFQAEVG